MARLIMICMQIDRDMYVVFFYCCFFFCGGGGGGCEQKNRELYGLSCTRLIRDQYSLSCITLIEICMICLLED